MGVRRDPGLALQTGLAAVLLAPQRYGTTRGEARAASILSPTGGGGMGGGRWCP